MSKRQRDSQRSRLYNADDALIPWSEPLPEMEDLERYTKWVFGLKRLRNALPGCLSWKTPDLRDGRRRNTAAATAWTVWMPRHSRKSYILLHELAHVLTRRTYGYEVAGHGWEYCSVFLKLVLYAMGREAYNALKASFKRYRVKFKAPRKRKPLSPEQRAAAAERLAKARAVRAKKLRAKPTPRLPLEGMLNNFFS